MFFQYKLLQHQNCKINKNVPDYGIEKKYWDWENASSLENTRTIMSLYYHPRYRRYSLRKNTLFRPMSKWSKWNNKAHSNATWVKLNIYLILYTISYFCALSIVHREVEQNLPPTPFPAGWYGHTIELK